MSFLDPKAMRDWCIQRFQSKDDILKTKEGVEENTEEGKCVDALVVKEVFQSVSNGKHLIASAITGKGVQTDAGDTFETMAGNIGEIVAGGGGSGPISSPYIFSVNWTLALCSAETMNIFVPFAITNPKRMVIKRLSFYGRKSSTSNSIGTTFQIVGKKKGSTAQAAIKNYGLILSGSSTSYKTSADITDEEIDLSEWEEVNGIQFDKWSYSGTVTTGSATLNLNAELYF